MRVTNDKYELPLTPPMHAKEMAALLHIHEATIRKKTIDGNNRAKNESSLAFVRVELTDDD